ncbi:hypothetical protein B0H16DRAFT_1454978 [Mycena metata]|uniref:Uncharacterized protein n=1 Tax=Mycena metata TaxID=1033252 RepID=A0AAD7JFH2_9AGAR|nr:hypothetical protein B0H16DRAFT_1454978 [Mycena metata]
MPAMEAVAYFPPVQCSRFSVIRKHHFGRSRTCRPRRRSSTRSEVDVPHCGRGPYYDPARDGTVFCGVHELVYNGTSTKMHGKLEGNRGARELMGSDLYSKLTDYSANHFKRSSRCPHPEILRAPSVSDKLAQEGGRKTRCRIFEFGDNIGFCSKTLGYRLGKDVPPNSTPIPSKVVKIPFWDVV